MACAVSTRAALGPMGRRGVGQLDVLGHVGGREDHLPAAVRPLHGHASILRAWL